MVRLQLFLAALWWGSLTAVAFLVVPLLFVHSTSPAEAGRLAAKLFTAQTWVGVVCGMALLVATQRNPQVDAAETPAIWVIAGVILALMVEVGVKPHILARENMALWHNLGSALYLLQWGCAAKVLWQQGGVTPAVASTSPSSEPEA